MSVATLLPDAVGERSDGRHFAATAPRAARTVLLVAWYFPPIAGAGSFRTMRFARYLADFGWRPVVLSVDPQRSQERVDPELLLQVPDSTLVERTGVFNPEHWLSAAIKRLAGHSRSARDSTSDAASLKSQVPLGERVDPGGGFKQ